KLRRHRPEHRRDRCTKALQCDAGTRSQFSNINFMRPVTFPYYYVDLFKLRASDGCLQICKSKIVPRYLMPIIAFLAAHTMAAKKAHFAIQFRITSGHHSPFSSGDCLCGMEAKCPNSPQSSLLPVLPATT